MKRYAILFSIVTLVACFVISKGQTSNNFNYSTLPVKYHHTDSNKEKIQANINAKFPNAYDLTKSLPANYVKDGSVDYTTNLQEAINNNPIVCFPNFPILINNNGLSLKSNSTVIFKPKSALILSPTNQPGYAILKIANIQNVKVYYPVIIGDRDKHLGTKGEWGMGISVTSAQNIEIYSPKVSKCWGDGIYVTGTTAQNSSNILISKPQLDYNRRNGISIISGIGINIIGGAISNTFGTDPMSGIDFEPDGGNNDINNVLVKGLVTYNNAGSGVLISLSRLPSEQAKQVNIDIDGHVDERSQNAFWLGGFYDSYKNGQGLTGKINITNSKWIDNKVPFKGNDNYQFAPNISFKNNNILKKNTQGYKKDDSSMMSMKKVWGAKSHINVQ